MIRKLKLLYYLIKTQVVYKLILFSLGKKSRIIKPIDIVNAAHISIGSNVLIRNGARIEVVDPQSEVVIEIGNNVNIEQNCHIVGRVKIKIEDDVTITGNCSIVDVVHPYEDISNPIKIGQRISTESYPVTIGKGSFIGFGAHIGPGVKIGNYCVIGAGAVVVEDLPDYTVAAGVPAKIIKKYSAEDKRWLSGAGDSNFHP
ncbi:acyltransferase [Cronobacter sakazakii]|uniref:acyltransferase n=1 Tax=Cronobacter sakazakii TaxID=28141 RepID=UPI000DA259D1|nr:acyltransferase [Cronobacter sakazakii]